MRAIFGDITRIMFSIIGLQFFSIILFIAGLGVFFTPLVLIINASYLEKIFFEGERYYLKDHFKMVKDNFVRSIPVLMFLLLLITGFLANLQFLDNIIINDLSIYLYFITILISIILGITLLNFLIYFPLVSLDSELNGIELLRISIIMPFYKLRYTFILIAFTMIMVLFFISNLLFIILFGINIVLIVNVIVYRYFYLEKN